MHRSGAGGAVRSTGKAESMMGRKAGAGRSVRVWQHPWGAQRWPGCRSQEPQLHRKTKKRVVEQSSG